MTVYMKNHIFISFKKDKYRMHHQNSDKSNNFFKQKMFLKLNIPKNFDMALGGSL